MLWVEGEVHGRDDVELPERKQHPNQPEIHDQPVVIARSSCDEAIQKETKKRFLKLKIKTLKKLEAELVIKL